MIMEEIIKIIGIGLTGLIIVVILKQYKPEFALYISLLTGILIIIVLFYKCAKNNNDQYFRWMWLTIVLSFAFYIPVVLWADVVPMIGMLMIPKTCAYVWTVLIGYNAMNKCAD